MQGGEAPGPLVLAGSWLRARQGACFPQALGATRGQGKLGRLRGRLCSPPPKAVDCNSHPLPISFSSTCTRNWRRGELGLAGNPRPAGVSDGKPAGGCKDLDSSAPPEPVRQSREESLSVGDHCSRAPVLTRTVPFRYLCTHR